LIVFVLSTLFWGQVHMPIRVIFALAVSDSAEIRIRFPYRFRLSSQKSSHIGKRCPI
jgi:hypothetical protein